MRITDIALKNLMRRKGKACFILAGLAIGVATVVAVNSYVDAMTRNINEKLEKYGANILIVPKTDNLSLNYGGISLGGVSFEMQEIRQDALAAINGIKNARNIAALGPMVLGAVNIEDRKVLLAGVDFEALRILKPWWKVSGENPGSDQILLGAEVARVTAFGKGQSIMVEGRPMTVSGVVQPTGSQDDQLIFTGIETAQALLGKAGHVSLVEVAALCNACPIDDMVHQISEALPTAKVMAIQKVVKAAWKLFRNSDGFHSAFLRLSRWSAALLSWSPSWAVSGRDSRKSVFSGQSDFEEVTSCRLSSSRPVSYRFWPAFSGMDWAWPERPSASA